MRSFLVVTVLCIVAKPIQALFEEQLTRCFTGLGCFEATGAFYDAVSRPFLVLPNDPGTINTVYRLYTKRNSDSSQILNTDEGFDFNSTNIDFTDETKIIVHGFREKENDWMREMKDGLLSMDSMNVITVDWETGANIPYTLACSNTRVVGAETGLLIERLQNAGLKLSKLHIIGFSLGSHIAGYAGARLKGQVRRITGMDPAGPLFAGMQSVVTLDKSDAQFVDVIHTDGKIILQLSYGTKSTFGHIDFYPNGGHDQPGCPQSTTNKITTISMDAVVKGLDQATDDMSCRHRRSRQLFLDSIMNDTMVAYPCKDYETFLKGQCGSCGANGTLCGTMGIMAEQRAPNNWQAGGVKLYLKTTARSPFRMYHYQLTIKTPKDESSGGIFGFSSKYSFGTVSATLKGESGHSIAEDLNKEAQVFESGRKYHFLLTTEESLGEIESLKLEYKPSSSENNLYHLKWHVEEKLHVQSVVLTDMNQLFEKKETSNAVTLCSSTMTLTAKTDYTYIKGNC